MRPDFALQHERAAGDAAPVLARCGPVASVDVRLDCSYGDGGESMTILRCLRRLSRFTLSLEARRRASHRICRVCHTKLRKRALEPYQTGGYCCSDVEACKRYRRLHAMQIYKGPECRAMLRPEAAKAPFSWRHPVVGVSMHWRGKFPTAEATVVTMSKRLP